MNNKRQTIILTAYVTYVYCRLADIRDARKDLDNQQLYLQGELFDAECRIKEIESEDTVEAAMSAVVSGLDLPEGWVE